MGKISFRQQFGQTLILLIQFCLNSWDEFIPVKQLILFQKIQTLLLIHLLKVASLLNNGQMLTIVKTLMKIQDKIEDSSLKILNLQKFISRIGFRTQFKILQQALFQNIHYSIHITHQCKAQLLEILYQ